RLAANPATPAPLLAALVDDVLARPAQPIYQDRTRYLETLAANPATPQEKVQDLLNHNRDLAATLMRRPDLTPEMALTYLSPNPSNALLATAISCVTDPGGVLAQFAIDHG